MQGCRQYTGGRVEWQYGERKVTLRNDQRRSPGIRPLAEIFRIVRSSPHYTPPFYKYPCFWAVILYKTAEKAR